MVVGGGGGDGGEGSWVNLKDRHYKILVYFFSSSFFPLAYIRSYALVRACAYDLCTHKILSVHKKFEMQKVNNSREKTRGRFIKVRFLTILLSDCFPCIISAQSVCSDRVISSWT